MVDLTPIALAHAPDAPAGAAAAPAPASPPSLVRGIVLRLAFCYWMLFCVPIISSVIYGLGWAGKLIDAAWGAIEIWIGKHVLAIPYDFSATGNGSGDRTADWVFLFCIACLALIATMVWSAVDRRRAHDARLRELLRVVIRYTLAFVILSYGLTKVFFGQFPVPSPQRLTQAYGDSSPMGLMWTFMGASPAYVFFAGAAETLGALLLLFRRTTTLGALVLTAVLTNVVMMNFCYDVPVKINSAHYLAMCVFLILPDLARLANVLVFHRPTQPALRALQLPRRWMRVTRAVVKYGVIATVLFVQLKGELAVTTQPTSWYEGYWNVTAFTRDGKDVPPLITDTTRWRRFRFQVYGSTRYLRWRYMDDSTGDLYLFTVDDAAKTVALTPEPEEKTGKPKHPTGPVLLRYVRSDADHLTLEGKVGAETLSVQLERMDGSKMLLVSRGFHWINEVPFNR